MNDRERRVVRTQQDVRSSVDEERTAKGWPEKTISRSWRGTTV